MEYKACEHVVYIVYMFYNKDEGIRDETNYMVELGRKGYTQNAIDEKKVFLGALFHVV